MAHDERGRWLARGWMKSKRALDVRGEPKQCASSDQRRSSCVSPPALPSCAPSDGSDHRTVSKGAVRLGASTDAASWLRATAEVR